MYIKKIKDENIGPIKVLNIIFPFNDDGNPKPIIFVGENGSGKSMLLSNIVDALYEIAGSGFDDAWHVTETGGHEYYKSIKNSQISIGKEYMYSHIIFEENKEINYVLKSGKLTVQDFKEKSEYNSEDKISWDDDANYKKVNITEKDSKNIFNKNVICYFGPDRYEKPSWMGDHYYTIEEYEHVSIKERLSGHLENPISIKNVTAPNLQWLMDIIVDSRADIVGKVGDLKIVHETVNNLLLLGKTRNNLEAVMSAILGKEVYFGLNWRSHGGSRFNIKLKSDDSVVVPSLDSLSTGQIALFNIFSTIVRYADNHDLNHSINLDKISGIVIIDEIELHLHTTLQREIIPQMLKLFPKVQFIITTHAPLFLLGMEEIFGSDKYEIFQMPNAEKISVECFSEFQKAYSYFKETQTFMKEIANAINSNNLKPLIITEGSTDWKHMKAAYEKINEKEEFKSMDFEFLEYESKKSDNEKILRLEMGDSQLCTMCESFAKLKQDRKLIFIADRDCQKTNLKMGGDVKQYKCWGNNVYSLILPLPDHRKETPEICIEHYYKDNEIKTSVKIRGVERRLYMGNEFNSKGINFEEDIFCEKRKSCGPGKISIIEGTDDERVTKLSDSEGVNIALPKSEFAKRVLNKEVPFDNFDVSSFEQLFRVVKSILNEPLE